MRETGAFDVEICRVATPLVLHSLAAAIDRKQMKRAQPDMNAVAVGMPRQ